MLILLGAYCVMVAVGSSAVFVRAATMFMMRHDDQDSDGDDDHGESEEEDNYGADLSTGVSSSSSSDSRRFDEVSVLRTSADVVRLCQQRVSEQVFRVAVNNGVAPMPNAEMKGDRATRLLVQTLLSMTQRRALFLRVAADPNHWPRLRPLFGAPPYHFLQPVDDGMFRATGFAASRVNMVYDSALQASIVGSSHIGYGHFEDELGRVYWMDEMDRTQLAPGKEAFEDLGSTRLIVKLPRVSRRVLAGSGSTTASARLAIIKARTFPLPGSTVRARTTSKLQKLLRGGRPQHRLHSVDDGLSIAFRVNSVRLRDAASTTAMLSVTTI